ncbi:MAG TPA: SRPBCC domain-containing protein [Pseudomonadales bacterium]
MQTPRLIRELYLPREVVFDAWTDAGHLSQWYVPDGCEPGQVIVEPVPGGRFDVNWTDLSGAAVRESGTFTEITRPEGFVLTLGYNPVGAASGRESREVRAQGRLPHLRPEAAPAGTGRLRLILEDRVDACQIVLSEELGAGRLPEVTTERLLESYGSAFRQQWERRLDRLEAYFSAI